MKIFYFFLVAFVLFIQSCTIQKRQHLPGYHIEWNSNDSHSEVQKLNQCRGEILVQEDESVKTTSDFSAVEYAETMGLTSTIEKPALKATEKRVDTSKVIRDEQSKSHRLTFPSVIHAPIKLFFGSVQPDDKPRTDGMSIAAMVCGIVGIVIPVTGIILSILAIIFGGIGMGRTSRNTELKGRGMAIAGLVLGIVGLLIVLMLLIILSLSFGFTI
jgi:hypothetical protein